VVSHHTQAAKGKQLAVYPRSDSDRRVAAADLLATVTAIFSACGMTDADAALLAGTLVHSDRRGVHSHGTIRVPDYVGKLTREGVDPRGRPAIVSQRAGAIVVDGGNAMGQIGGTFAMDLAIDAARANGIAFAAVRGSNHCGALDWYTLRATEAGMAGLAGTNALPTMAPWGGIDKIVGINPLSVALPGGDAGPFVLDFAFGATAHGKIRVYHQKGADIPEGWAFDEEGRPTVNTAEALKGLIQPIGEHKGVALGMAIGMLSSLLSGGAYGTELGNMVDGPTAGKDAQFFIAIDVSAFTGLEQFRARVDAIRAEVHGSRRRAGVSRLLVPGELEAEYENSSDKSGILLAGQTINDILHEAEQLNVDAARLVG
jgi:LDH2 family malate/lactate/ureidoglycolate dehydrogenase